MASVALSNKTIGSIVKLKVNGTLRDFIVVHQGKPSALYDASCDGTWLLMKDCYEAKRWHSSNVNDYANSEINSYLNSTFLNLIDANIRNQIKQVKLPYRPGSGANPTPINSGANGLSAKVFLLSGPEVNWTSSTHSYIPNDGACLAYFSGCATTDSKRIANLNGSAALWWLRSPYCNSNNGATNALNVNTNGNWSNNNCSNGGYAIRPALMGNEMSRQEYLLKTVCHLSKGVASCRSSGPRRSINTSYRGRPPPPGGAVGYRGEADRY